MKKLFIILVLITIPFLGFTQKVKYDIKYSLAKINYEEGYYKSTLNNLKEASHAPDKPDSIDLKEMLKKAKICHKTQSRAIKLLKKHQYTKADKAIAKTLAINPNARYTLFIAQAINPKKYCLAKVKGGQFTRAKGTTEEHQVYVDDFKIGKYEVSWLAYAVFLRCYNSDTIKAGKYAGKPLFYKTWRITKNKKGFWEADKDVTHFPMDDVTWYGAYEFCRFYGGSLPSEAQWEYAARGGSKSKNYKYSGSDSLNLVGWYKHSNPSMMYGHGVWTRVPGYKVPNELGLYDMTGNVWEWCLDWYDENYYSFCKSKGVMNNPQGPHKGSFKVLRGCSSNSYEENCDITNRYKFAPLVSFENDSKILRQQKIFVREHGFRIVFPD